METHSMMHTRHNTPDRCANRRPNLALALTVVTATWMLFGVVAFPSHAQLTVRPWMVELSDAPATTIYVEQRAAALADGVTPEAAHLRATTEVRRQLQQIDRAQQRVLAALAPEARVVGQVQRVYNGLLLLADAPTAEATRRIPGVTAVHAVTPKQRTNSTSVPFIGTATTWNDFGVTGAGIRLGIIDTGVDYLHTGFGGSGDAADYLANDTTSIGDGFFPTAKVVDGWDFVGDAYDAASDDAGIQTPVPDPDPMDCDGHGTHVAGTAAAFGTNGDGSTFLGPWDATTPFGTLGVGPGVAPEASVVALRVFGCAGETAVVELALDWAVDPDGNGDFSDRLDVVNLSLTSPFADPEDPTAIAATNAVATGVVVVAAAGNEGDQHYAIGSPALADGVLAVAASWDDDATFPARAVRIESPAGIAGTHQAGGANFGPALAGPLTADAVLADPPDACAPLTNAAAEIDGKIAVIDRSDACTYVTQVRNAQEAGTTGALGVVFVNDRDGLEGVFNDGTGGDITIPPLMIRQVAGQGVKDQLPGLVELTMTPALLADMAGSFSSRGPRRGAVDNGRDLAIAPQIAAPGVAITSLRLGDSAGGGTGAKILSGTSMATPHVAGAAALLRQLRPTWEPVAIAAALAQTSTAVTFDPEGTPPLMSPVRMGAGRLQTDQALATEVVAFDNFAPDRIGLSFGLAEGTPGATGSTGKVVRFENRGANTASFDLTLQLQEPVIGIVFSLPIPTVTVPAGGTQFVEVRLGFNGSVLRHQRDPTLDPSTLGFPRHWLTEAAGWIEATPTSADTVPLRIPVYVAPRPIGVMRAVAARGAERSNFVLNLAGIDLEGGPQEQGWVTALERQDQGSSGDPFSLRGVGVGSDFLATGDLATSRIFFGFSAAEPWATPHAVRAEVLIDTDRDGFADFVLTNSDRGSEAFDFVTDAFASVLHDLGASTSTVQDTLAVLPPTEGTTRPFHSRIMVLPVSAGELGLLANAARFDYAVSLAPREAAGTIAQRQSAGTEGGGGIAMPPDPLTWDPENPGVSFAGGFDDAPLWPDLSLTRIPVAVDTDALAANGSSGILLLHHHNREEDQSENLGLDLLQDALVFGDGFEVGGTELWSVTVP